VAKYALQLEHDLQAVRQVRTFHLLLAQALCEQVEMPILCPGRVLLQVLGVLLFVQQTQGLQAYQVLSFFRPGRLALEVLVQSPSQQVMRPTRVDPVGL
jgi:sorbitol-specific phosphotransferase system component IIBC